MKGIFKKIILAVIVSFMGVLVRVVRLWATKLL